MLTIAIECLGVTPDHSGTNSSTPVFGDLVFLVLAFSNKKLAKIIAIKFPDVTPFLLKEKKIVFILHFRP